MSRRVFLFALSLLVVSLCGARASACGCIGVGSPCEAFGGAVSVFVGTVTGIKEGSRTEKPDSELVFKPRLVKLTVEQSFLGDSGAEVEVATGLGGYDCGYPFVKGETYLVYTYRNGKDERQYTSTCTRTKLVARADEDFAYLRISGGPTAAAAGVAVYGSVIRRLSYPDQNLVRPSVSMEGAMLSLQGAGGSQETRSDAEGHFRFAGLSPGEYKLTLRLPDELMTGRPERVVKVGPRGCASEVYYVTDNGRISGRILDSEGKPAASVGVTVMDAKGSNLEMWGGLYSKTDEDGRYHFAGLPAGEYMLGINVTGQLRALNATEKSKGYVCQNCVQLGGYLEPEELTSVYPRLFYPGVMRLLQATHLYLTPGQELRDVDWSLPPRRAQAQVRGQVVWEDGSPVPGADVTYRDATYEDLSFREYAVRADERGEFTFKAYVGGRYVVKAESGNPFPGGWHGPGPAEYTPPVSVSVANPSETIKVVIKRLK